jgi:hypothetical protein
MSSHAVHILADRQQLCFCLLDDDLAQGKWETRGLGRGRVRGQICQAGIAIIWLDARCELRRHLTFWGTSTRDRTSTFEIVQTALDPVFRMPSSPHDPKTVTKAAGDLAGKQWCVNHPLPHGQVHHTYRTCSRQFSSRTCASSLASLSLLAAA